MTTFVVEAWWTAIRHATIAIDADSAADALDKADLMLGEGDDDWIGFNEECDDSYGETNLSVWDEGLNRQLGEKLGDETRLERAGGKLLRSLDELLRAYSAAVECDPQTGKAPSGETNPFILNAISAVREARGTGDAEITAFPFKD